MLSDETICGLGQFAIAAPPGVHVNVTVTLELLQPLAFGAGEAAAVIVGGVPVATVKLAPLLATFDSVTTMLPVLAPFGTGTTMLVGLQLVGIAAVPLKVTKLEP